MLKQPAFQPSPYKDTKALTLPSTASSPPIETHRLDTMGVKICLETHPLKDLDKVRIPPPFHAKQSIISYQQIVKQNRLIHSQAVQVPAK